MHKNIKATVREETKHVQSIYNKISYIYFYLVNKQKKNSALYYSIPILKES